MPVASATVLITGALERGSGDAAALPDTASLMASAEPSTRSKRSRSSRAVVDRGAQLGQQRAGLGPQVLDFAAQAAQRVEHPHEHDHEGREAEGAEHGGEDDGELARGHCRSVLGVRPVGVRSLMRSAISCSNPWTDGS